MIIQDKTNINITNRNIAYFNEKGYSNIKVGDILSVDVIHLKRYSRVKVKVECTSCHTIKNMTYSKYMDNIEYL